MNSSASPNGQQHLPPLNTLIRPEQVRKLPNFPEEQKQKYSQGVTKLWQTIQSNPETSPERQNAYRKLVEVSMSIKNMMKKQQDASGAPAPAVVPQIPGRPTSSGQPIPPNAQALAAPMGPLTAQPASETCYSEKVMEKVKELKVIVPASYLQTHGPQARQRYISEAKNKYALNLQKYESYNIKLIEMHNANQAREMQGRPLNSQEKEKFQASRLRLDQLRNEAQNYLTQWGKMQALALKNQPGQAGAGVIEHDVSHESAVKHEPNQHASGLTSSLPTPFAPEHHGQAHTVSSALDAARNQGHPDNRSGASPPPNSRPPTSAQGTAPTSYHVAQGQTPNTQPHPPIKAEQRLQEPQHNSPHNVPSHMQHPGEPYALSHQAAMEHARSSYTNGTSYPQPTPQSATHSHPTHYNNGRGDQQPNSHSKMPIPKDFNMPVPQPVSMGQARPTLTGGPHTVGPIGQPAIQKHPGYVLEGEGERVLSKKKLEELVRQVTGGTGAESDEGESLTAEVEEVFDTLMLEIASLSLT